MHSTTSISLSYHSARPELPASCCQRSPPPSSAGHDGCLLVLSQLVLALVGRVLLRRALPLTLARRRQLRQLSWEQGKIAYNCNVDVDSSQLAASRMRMQPGLETLISRPRRLPLQRLRALSST